MHQLARYEIEMRPAPGAAPGARPARIICKPEKDAKPVVLTADMTPVEFAYWVDAFEAYHAGSHMEVANVANAVGRGRGRGRGTDTGAKVREPWVRPNLPYTKEQCRTILGWYPTRELCSMCGNNKN
jgi:hypothetical protein